MSAQISAQRVAAVVGDFDRSPAFAGLAHALRLAIGDGRLPLNSRLPSERELTGALDVSRTTVTRAYADLRESGFALARRGAGTFTTAPAGARTPDRALTPAGPDPTRAHEPMIDLNCAASPAPSGLADLYADATARLPAYLASHGYFPAGLPALQETIAQRYAARGLPTDADQIVVVPGALAGAAVLAQALTGPGDRVLVESPTYPNAVRTLRSRGARVLPSPVDPAGWDREAALATVRQSAPRLAYLVPDFHNPTGHLLDEDDRAAYAETLRATRTRAVIDESLVDLPLEGQRMPRPFAAFLPGALTIGSISKGLWGGLRIGWIRASRDLVDPIIQARLALDLGSPILEQLVALAYLSDPDAMLSERRATVRRQRDALIAGLRRHLPDWEFRTPAGGLTLWCRLPEARGSAFAAVAAQQRVQVAPGPMFAVEGGMDRFVRLPYARPAEELTRATEVMAEAWALTLSGDHEQGRAPDTFLVA